MDEEELRQREEKRSHKDFLMDVEDLEELYVEEFNTKRPDKEPKVALSKERPHSVHIAGDSGAEAVESSLPIYPVCVSHDPHGERGGEEENLSSMLESWVYHDDELNKDDCPETSNVTHSSFIAVPGSAIATTISSILGPMVSLPMTETASLITSMCGPIGSAWDTLSSTSRIPGFSARDPVSAAAHLHLLGESLYLIGHHLKDTNKLVCVSSGLLLLLDSLLCALAPLICLTSQIPELSSSTEHSLASTLENIAYLMPGL